MHYSVQLVSYPDPLTADPLTARGSFRVLGTAAVRGSGYETSVQLHVKI